MPLHGRDKLSKAFVKVSEEMNNKLVAIYTQGLTAIVRATPVHFKDGGRLKNNWFLTTSQPSSKTRGGSKGGIGSFADIGKLPKSVLGKKVYFTNNLPYAGMIEYGGYPNPVELGTWTGNKYQKLSAGGYSRQAPNGMARIAIKKMEARIKKI